MSEEVGGFIIRRRESGAGSLAASYALRHDLSSTGRTDSSDAATSLFPARSFPTSLPTAAGAQHKPQNITDGTVVLTEQKIKTRYNNEIYLRSHPELGEMIESFVIHMLQTRQDNVIDAAIDFFTTSQDKQTTSNNNNNAQANTSAQQ